MAKLAIKGHPTRGKEVIEILEMLGGKNAYNFIGACNVPEFAYSINEQGIIDLSIFCLNSYDTIFTLEEFLERFPYKVGDKVWLHYKNVNVRLAETITRVHWCNKSNCILYDLSIYGNLRESDLTPYKEEIMENKDTISHTTEINLNHPCFNGHNEIELIIPKDWKFEQRDGKMFGVRKQYPKTYEESCEILNIPSNGSIAYIGNWVYGGEYLEKHLDRLRKFQQLLICRDAYWKLSGDEMGLDKLWKPYNGQESRKKHVIQTVYDKVTCLDTWCQTRNILEFPTAEIRDTFYENFKKLIEGCKELL